MPTDSTPWFVVILADLVMILFIPYAAWNGKPRGFKRLNWFGVTVGASLFGLILFVVGANFASFLLYISGVVVGIGMGSLVALFFCRPSG